MNEVSVRTAQQALVEGKRVQVATYLPFLFIPISPVATIFGKNVAELEDSPLISLFFNIENVSHCERFLLIEGAKPVCRREPLALSRWLAWRWGAGTLGHWDQTAELTETVGTWCTETFGMVSIDVLFIYAPVLRRCRSSSRCRWNSAANFPGPGLSRHYKLRIHLCFHQRNLAHMTSAA